MIQESLRGGGGGERTMQEGCFLTLTSERKSAFRKWFRGTCLLGICEILLLEHCFWGVVSSHMFFSALPQANHDISLPFFLGLLNPGSGWWFTFRWSLTSGWVSATEAGGRRREGTRSLETNSSHRRKWTMRLLRRVWHHAGQMNLRYRLGPRCRRM